MCVDRCSFSFVLDSDIVRSTEELRYYPTLIGIETISFSPLQDTYLSSAISDQVAANKAGSI